MYKCADCNQIQPPRMPAIAVIVEERPVTYSNGFNEEGLELISKGSEIVREKRICPPCAGMKVPDRVLNDPKRERVEEPVAVVVKQVQPTYH